MQEEGTCALASIFLISTVFFCIFSKFPILLHLHFFHLSCVFPLCFDPNLPHPRTTPLILCLF